MSFRILPFRFVPLCHRVSSCIAWISFQYIEATQCCFVPFAWIALRNVGTHSFVCLTCRCFQVRSVILHWNVFHSAVLHCMSVRWVPCRSNPWHPTIYVALICIYSYFCSFGSITLNWFPPCSFMLDFHYVTVTRVSLRCFIRLHFFQLHAIE